MLKRLMLIGFGIVFTLTIIQSFYSTELASEEITTDIIEKSEEKDLPGQH
ncbi:hypothetical protein ACTWQB_16700 [Piscibacillus sp. B03]